jgi:DNA-binding response OmpR family regulator
MKAKATAKRGPTVLFSGLSVPEREALQNGLAAKSFQIKIVSFAPELFDEAENPYTVIIICTEKYFKNCAEVIQEGKAISGARWILLTRNTDAAKRQELIKAGADAVFHFPLQPQEILLKCHDIFGKIKGDWEKSLVGEDSFAPRARLGLEILKPSRANVDQGIWKALPHRVSKRMTCDEIKTQLKERFLECSKSLQGSVCQIRLMTFAGTSPFPEDSTENYLIIAGTDLDISGEVLVPQVDYPEITRVKKAQRTMVYTDAKQALDFVPLQEKMDLSKIQCVAAIPLFRGSTLFGFIQVRLDRSMDKKVRGFLENLTGYAEDLTPWAMRLDFLLRQTRFVFKKAA